MKERPILFSGPMVRALLDGSKTQTRRVLKQATGPSLSVGMDDDTPGVAWLSWLWGDGPGHEVHETIKRVPCPYGVPGDRLWVRETWGFEKRTEDDPLLEPVATYRADEVEHLYPVNRWRPSIHMSRHLSRITLEVAAVRVERLQDISEGDAIAEGCKNSLHLPGGRFANENFAHLWWSINGEGSWEANPWVWVVEFRRLP